MNRIAFHGVPRSGTSWVGSILDSSPYVKYRHQPLFSYYLKSYLDQKSSKKSISNFFDLLNHTNDDFILQRTEKEKGAIPVFNKSDATHLIYKEARYHHILKNMMKKDDSVKVVGIVRNPKSVLSSWSLAPKEFKKNEWTMVDEWKFAKSKNQDREEEFYGYEKWKETTSIFLELEEKYPNRFYLLNYSSLLKNTESKTKELFDFCGIPFEVQTRNFIQQSKQIDLSSQAYSVYRKNQRDDKWKKVLPFEIIREIDIDIKGTKLEKFNL